MVNGIDRLLKLRDGVKEQVAAYLQELDRVHAQLRKDAETMLDALGSFETSSSASSSTSSSSSTDEEEAVNKRRLTISAVNLIPVGNEFTVKDVLRLVSQKPGGNQVEPKGVRNVVSKIAKRNDSPLVLVREGGGNEPNVYRRLRDI